jgi:lysozyme family protein
MDAVQPTSAADQAAARWEAVFERLLKTEGGFVDSPGDHGGATKYGLSLRFLSQQGLLSPALMAEVDINHDGVVDLPDIAGMTIATARDVYWAYFWDGLAATLPQPLVAAVFDQTVNDGAVPAVKLLQQGLCSLAGNLWTPVDGVLGPRTRALVTSAIDTFGPDKVLDGYRAQAAARYRMIAQRDPSQAKFLDGWLNRARELGDV